jgi:hypothetical protein
MDKIKCILSIKEFSVTEDDRELSYMAIYPSDLAEEAVDKAIKYKLVILIINR